MTTLVHAFSSYLPPGHKLQVIHRVIETGRESVLHDGLDGHVVVAHHVWEGVELVIREVSEPANETAAT